MVVSVVGEEVDCSGEGLIIVGLVLCSRVLACLP